MAQGIGERGLVDDGAGGMTVSEKHLREEVVSEPREVRSEKTYD